MIKTIAKIGLPLDAPKAIDNLRHKFNLPTGKPSLSAYCITTCMKHKIYNSRCNKSHVNTKGKFTI